MSKPAVSTPLNAFLQSPLHAFDLRSRLRTAEPSHGVLAAEIAHLGYLVLRGHAGDAAFMAHAAAVLGMPLATQPGRWQAITHGAALWLSPDERLLVCRRSARDGLQQALNEALAGVHAQVVDVSGGLTTVRIAGREHVRLLRHLGPYDFERLPVGRCVGTVMSKAAVTVLRTDDAGVLLVFRRSFADYLWRLIERNALAYGLCIVAPQAHADPVFTPLLENIQ